MACMNSFPIILLASAFLLIFIAHGRQFPNADMVKNEEIGARMMRGVIGSRPPKCENRCRNCGKCEAVQVPIAPAKKFLDSQIYGKIAANTVEYSRGDGVSGYKPMCWKCKCGNFIFNP
ncbi:EPIDERMAL PATTERNING FACTOR-like protein 2 [Salvia splendens]|uniref:EPIDERMAL PATTERNING FACTOR-like protein 2 n=1 Tax=Salvia splendens TaxID=180675 RepID=UPI001C2644D9|nr:EPIDERMAL PATTERNING FACTOR-like protein 2 [Salvia splendens]